MKKAIGKIHLWLGLASGLIVFIISITGCIYVFEHELKSFFYKNRQVIEVPDHAVLADDAPGRARTCNPQIRSPDARRKRRVVGRRMEWRRYCSE